MFHVYIGAGITVLAQLLTAAFIYGRFTQKVESHSQCLKQHEQMLDQHQGEIGVLYGHAGLQR